MSKHIFMGARHNCPTCTVQSRPTDPDEVPYPFAKSFRQPGAIAAAKQASKLRQIQDGRL